MKKIISLQNVSGKKTIKFLCDDDFSKRTTHVLVYFNDLNISHYNLHAELLITENNQPQTNVFDLHIPNGANSATIIMSTIIKGQMLDSINVWAV